MLESYFLSSYGGKGAVDEFFIQSKMDYHGVIRNSVGNDLWRVVRRRLGICQSHVSDSQFDSAFGSDYECGKGISDWQERHWHHTFNMFGYNNIALMGYISMGLELYCQGINNRI
ncbi:hypothetical protein E7747_09960 [Duncaniella dubosii]|uniref:Uncharacterized protein n=1 Tax=Duncaniella dubosii TaxID=2518971 RepID=A0A4P7W3J5_9BACT|nr:hypothetical protein [Duncaniella dubosii]QCD42573.1 hypothetical protein E7747_09960 [Duncaniella dubosii]